MNRLRRTPPPAPPGTARTTRTILGWLAATLTLTMVLAACLGSAISDSKPMRQSRDSSVFDTKPPTADAVIARVPREQWRAMKRAGMVRPECPVQRRSRLRVVRINFIDFDGHVRRGELVVNADVASSVVRIFGRLFDERFPIRKMRPVEKYRGDSNASLRAGNTSAYNCRRADQINAPFRESPHANGRAVDINPRENPWKDLRCRCWFPNGKLRARVPGPGVIVRSGLVWKTFKSEGWFWQNIGVPDYMHFDTGYPSRPIRARSGDIT